MNDQFEEIGRYKVNTPAANFITKETEFLLPFLKYTYRLKFNERPNYSKLKFMLKNILIEREFVPDNKFDWSLC